MRDEDGQRTYGIWSFVAVFCLVGLVGLFLLLFGGGTDTPTQVVPTSQTLPAPPLTAAPTTTAAAGTAGGQDLPEGVSQVLVDGTSTSYVFDPPADSSVDEATASAQVAPLRVSVADDGRTATLTVGCAGSTDELLAQVVVDRGETSVTFAAIALVPEGGAPCVAGAARTVRLELPDALDGRSVVVVPAGTAVPEVGGG